MKIDNTGQLALHEQSGCSPVRNLLIKSSNKYSLTYIDSGARCIDN